MIQHVEINNFQSLHHVSLDLSPLTVIVGPSSSGKSAFTRAIKCLTSNARGTSFISHGERTMTVKATTEHGTVTLKRGKGADDNEYVLVPSDPNLPQPSPYSKLGGAVPEEVSRFIGIDAKDPINYAGQFDRPYLLGSDTSGGEVARVLGALTNVNIIFDGAREANRRKLAHGATLKTRSTDLEAIMEKAATYAGIKEQRAALDRAETALARARELQGQLSRIEALLEDVKVSSGALKAAEQVLSVAVPSTDALVAAREQLDGYSAHLATLKQAGAEIRLADQALEQLDADEEALKAEFSETLAQLAGGIMQRWADAEATFHGIAGDGAHTLVVKADEGSALAADYIAEVLAP